MTERLPIRVFISSPSDVRPERLIAERVVRRLDREFAYHFRIEPMMWEREPLLASHHFQELIAPPSESDIVVVMLWSRLGVPLPADKYRGSLSGQPVTGTEWEFEEALAAARVRQLPDLLLYRKRATITVELGDRTQLEEQQHQAELVEAFMQRWTRDASGKSFTAASWEFADAAAFESLIEDHLRALLRKRLTASSREDAPAGIGWHAGSPYRGLLSFELEHAPVFFGRTRARNELRELLARQIAQGTAFVLVIGGSGSGKSSLVKSGVLSDLREAGMLGRTALCRYAIARPGTAPTDAPDDPLAGLSVALTATTALPELAGEPIGYTWQGLRDLLRDAPALAVPPIRQALGLASRAAGVTELGEARLVVIVDQLEELFTADGIGPAARTAYVAALDALARSGLVWVLATLRSDCFDRLETLPTLATLSRGEARYLLTPPAAAEIGQIIRQPAREAGLRFETDARTGRSLDETILEAAAGDTASLPLLEYLLEQLWQQRTEHGMLTFAAYAALGGLEGAIGRRAEEVLNAQPPAVQAALPALLRALVTVGQGDGAIAMARMVPLGMFVEGSAARRLVEAFLAPNARLLVTNDDGGGTQLRVAHEALLFHWPRSYRQIQQDRVLIRFVSRLEDVAFQWAQAGEADEYLLTPGNQMLTAREILDSGGFVLSDHAVSFIKSSLAAYPADQLNVVTPQMRRHKLRLLPRELARSPQQLPFVTAMLKYYERNALAVFFGVYVLRFAIACFIPVILLACILLALPWPQPWHWDGHRSQIDTVFRALAAAEAPYADLVLTFGTVNSLMALCSAVLIVARYLLLRNPGHGSGVMAVLSALCVAAAFAIEISFVIDINRIDLAAFGSAAGAPRLAMTYFITLLSLGVPAYLVILMLPTLIFLAYGCLMYFRAIGLRRQLLALARRA